MSSILQPVPTNYIDLYRSNLNPSEIHAKNAYLTRFFEKYLIEKAMSVIEFKGLPETWEKNYFLYTLYLGGYIGVFRTDDYGVICNYGSLSGELDIWYQPKKFMVFNPALKEYHGYYDIWEDVGLIRLQPNYSGIWDIISVYSDIMALSVESAGINLINSKFGFVFACDSPAMAQSFKAIIDDVLSGRPATFADKKLFNEDGKLSYDMILGKPKDVYIQGEILNDLCAWDARFNTEIGIPNVNIAKQSGVSAEEVMANNQDTRAKAIIWLEQIREDLKRVNEMFDLNISAKLRFGGGVKNDQSEDLDTDSV